jgi:PilZ domain
MSARTFVARNKPDPDRPTFECRVYERHPCDIPARCHPASLHDMKDEGWEGAILDISQGGIRIHLRRRFERGTALAVELPGERGETFTVFVKVVHLRSDENGAWILGCKFVSDLSDDEVQRLIASQSRVNGSTNRIDTPVVDRFLSHVQIEFESERGESVVCIVNRLLIAKSGALAPGRKLRIHGRTSDGANRSFDIEVVALRQDGIGWRLESRFLASRTQHSAR